MRKSTAAENENGQGQSRLLLTGSYQRAPAIGRTRQTLRIHIVADLGLVIIMPGRRDR